MDIDIMIEIIEESLKRIKEREVKYENNELIKECKNILDNLKDCRNRGCTVFEYWFV